MFIIPSNLISETILSGTFVRKDFSLSYTFWSLQMMEILTLISLQKKLCDIFV